MKRVLSSILVLILFLSVISLPSPAYAESVNGSLVAGDANGDGNLNGADLIRIRKYLVGNDVEINLLCADVTGDGTVDLLDLVRLRKYLAGLDVELVPPKQDAEEGLPKPENPTAADDYFWENSTVIDVIDAEDSNDLLTEEEAIDFLAERGFDAFPVTYYATQNGQYVGDTSAEDGSGDKHPLYYTYYISSNNLVWTIYVVNNSIIAYPVSFNLESTLSAPLLYSESNKLTSYDNDSNRFYVTIPFESANIVKELETINAEALDNLTLEEIGKI